MAMKSKTNQKEREEEEEEEEEEKEEDNSVPMNTNHVCSTMFSQRWNIGVVQ